MRRNIFGWDLPPGVRVSDIPGNRPEDEAWEKIEEGFYALLDESAHPSEEEVVRKAIEYGIKIGVEQAEAISEEIKYYSSEYKRLFREKLRLFFKEQRKRIKELEDRR